MAKASAELDTDTLEDKFAELEKTSDVDKDLEALKAKMNKPQTPEGGA